MNLRSLIVRAYPSSIGATPANLAVKGGPGWLDSDQFEVVGAADDPATTTQAQLVEMLQTLLAQRFKLRFHRGTTEIQGYVLGVAKSGPKLKPSTHAGDLSSIFMDGDHVGVTATNAGMTTLTRWLSGVLSAPVIDQTQLTGSYEFTIPYQTRDDTPVIFTSLREFGLTIEAQKIKTEVIIVDYAEMPTPQ